MDSESRRRRRRYLQFGLSTFFWLALVIAAFFLGRSWDEFVLRVKSHFARGPISVRLQAGAPRMISRSESPIQRLEVSDPAVCDVELIDRNTVRVTGKQEGSADLFVWGPDENKPISYRVKVKR